LDSTYLRKYNDLVNREKEMIDRMANKMKGIEKYNYESRQKILRDMEDVKAREEHCRN
jgi:cell division protein FtsX